MRREFIINASHELRTPLTNLQGYLEALRDGVLPPDPATFDSLREEVDRLTRLAASLDVLAGAEGAAGVAREVDVGAIVAASADLVAPALARRSIALRVDAPAGFVVRARPDELTQVIANLLQNAMRYTPDGGQVEVSGRGRRRRGPGEGRQHRTGHPGGRPAADLGALLPGREVARPRARRGRDRARDRAPAGRGRRRSRRRQQRGRLDDVLAHAAGLRAASAVALLGRRTACTPDGADAPDVAGVAKAHGLGSSSCTPRGQAL